MRNDSQKMGPPKRFIFRPGEKRNNAITLTQLLHHLNKSRDKKATFNPESAGNNHKDSYYELSPEDRVSQEQLKTLRCALNKLVPDNFYKQLLVIYDNLPIHDFCLMKIFARQFVDKATNEEMYSVLYAQVCNALKTIVLSDVEDPDIYNVGSVIFDECYGRFCYALNSYDFSCPLSKNCPDQLDSSNKEDRKKTMIIGVCRFVADLFNSDMVTIEDIFKFIKKLELEESEKSIEGLCKLLSTSGKELESSVFHTEFSSDWCLIWDKVLNLSRNETLTLRLRYLLMNLLELMNNSWQSKNLRPIPKSSAEVLMNEDIDDDLEESSLTENKKDNSKTPVDISKDCSVSETEQHFLHLLKTNKDASSEITKWESQNFKGRKPWLIYALTRAVLRITIDGNTVNEASFSHYNSLLKRYIMSRQGEVACIYGVQFIVVVEMKNPKGLLVQVCNLLFDNGIVSYMALLDWRENWSKNTILEVNGKAEAQITLARFFMKLYIKSIEPSKYKSIVKELNSFDLEQFVSMSRLPPEIEKRIKMEEEREVALLKKNNDEPETTQKSFHSLNIK